MPSFETVVALKGVTSEDIADLGITAGQRRVLKLALEALGDVNFPSPRAPEPVRLMRE